MNSQQQSLNQIRSYISLVYQNKISTSPQSLLSSVNEQKQQSQLKMNLLEQQNVMYANKIHQAESVKNSDTKSLKNSIAQIQSQLFDIKHKMESLHSLKKDKNMIKIPKESSENKAQSHKKHESMGSYSKKGSEKKIKKEKNAFVSNSSYDDESFEISQDEQKTMKGQPKEINIKSIILLNAHRLYHEGIKNHLLKDILKKKIPDQTVITNNLMMERYDIVLKEILEVFIDYLLQNEHNQASTTYLLSKHQRSLSQNILNTNTNIQNNQMNDQNQQQDNKYSMQFLKTQENVSPFTKYQQTTNNESFQNITSQFAPNQQQNQQYYDPNFPLQQHIGQNYDQNFYGKNLQMNQQNHFQTQQMNQFDSNQQRPLPNFEAYLQKQQQLQNNVRSNNGSMIFQSQPPNSKDNQSIPSLAAIPTSTKSIVNKQIQQGQYPQYTNNQQYQQNNAFQQEKLSPQMQQEKNIYQNTESHKESKDSQSVQYQALMNQKSVDSLEVPQQKLERKSSSSQRFCDVRKNRKQEQLLNQTNSQIGDIRSLSQIQLENQQKLSQQMSQQQQNQQLQQQQQQKLQQNQQLFQNQQLRQMQQYQQIQQKDLQQFNNQFRQQQNINQKPSLDNYNYQPSSINFLNQFSPESNRQYQNNQRNEMNIQDFTNLNPISSLSRLPSFTQFQNNTYSQQKNDQNKLRQLSFQGQNQYDQQNMNFDQNNRYQSLPQTRQITFYNPDHNGTINDHLQIYNNKPSIIHQSNQIFNKPQNQVHFSHRYSNSLPFDSFNVSASRNNDSNNMSKILNNNSNPSLDFYQSPAFKPIIQINEYSKPNNQEQGFYQNSDIGMYGVGGNSQNQQIYHINLKSIDQIDDEPEYSSQLKIEPSYEQSQQDNMEFSRQTSLQKNLQNSQNKLELNLNKDEVKKIPLDQIQTQKGKLAHSKSLINVFKQNFSALSPLNTPTSVRSSNKFNKKTQPLKLMPCHKTNKSATVAETRRHSDNSLNSASTQNIVNQSQFSKQQSGSKTCKNCQITTNREDAKLRFSKLPPSIEQVGKKGKSSPSKDTQMRQIFSYPVSDIPKESKPK